MALPKPLFLVEHGRARMIFYPFQTVIPAKAGIQVFGNGAS